MCVRLLELPYQAAIFAGDESLGPSKINADPTTASTTKTSPPRLAQTRKPRPAIRPSLRWIRDPGSPRREERRLHCDPMDPLCLDAPTGAITPSRNLDDEWAGQGSNLRPWD